MNDKQTQEFINWLNARIAKAQEQITAHKQQIGKYDPMYYVLTTKGLIYKNVLDQINDIINPDHNL